GPDGRRIVQADGGTAPQNPIELAIVTETEGFHRLEVSARANDAPPSRYEVRIEELRTATREDRQRVARKSFADGKQLESQGTAESLRQALESYQRALSLWRSLENRLDEASALEQVGVVYYFLDEKQKALEAFQQELQLWRTLGDYPRELAEALNNIGVVSGSLGFSQKAIESYEESLRLRRGAGDRQGIANSLDNLGLAYLDSGDLQKSLDRFNEALPIYREVKNQAGIANALNNIGGVYLTWDDYRRAADYFVQALEIRRALGQRREEAIALNNLGEVYGSLGEAQKALDFHRQALDLRRVLGQRSAEAVSLNNIGMVYEWLGEPERALDNYQQALALFRATSDRNGEASALNNIAAYYLHMLKEPRRALDCELQALEIRRALGQRVSEAAELDNIGFIHNKMGDPKKALVYHHQALEMRRALGHRLGEAASLNHIGAAYFAMKEFQPAYDYFTQALGLYRRLGTRTSEAAALYGLAQIERDRGNLAEARHRIEESLNIIESLRDKVASQEFRASYIAGQQDYFEFYIDLLMRLHDREPLKTYDREALQASERARARSLLELLTEARIDVEQGIAPELKQRERANHSRLSWIQNRLIDAYSQTNPDKSRISLLEDDLKKADAERERIGMEIRQQHPRYAELRYPAPPDVGSIQSLLDEHTLLLEYSLGRDASFVFAITRKDCLGARLPSSSSIKERVQALRAIITSRPQRSSVGRQIELSRQLYRELVQPSAKLLAGKQKLIIVPSGVLNYLPFEVLLSSGNERSLAEVDPGKLPYLVRDYSISYVPSAGVLASLRGHPGEKSRSRKTFLAFADPMYSNEPGAEGDPLHASIRGAFGEGRSWRLGRLEESRREVEQIANLYPRDQVSLLLSEQATEENVKTAGRLGQYRFVHFAAHGLLNETNPSYSGLILSRPGVAKPRSTLTTSALSGKQPTDGASSIKEVEDGLLQVYEVFNLKLNADLVVLSACETGLGKEVRGEGLIGLTNAFLYAGTPSVTVSLWNVQDRSTADLMVRFYQQLDNGQDKAAALQQAKLKLIQNSRYAQPFYWAPFILIGDPK
ncbi:MAG TPA: CHAT domain-containing tetratricopeptide repeat protein, partial [Blastocatellia bacterium]|nr:CHAT domain-containing tetratricopeptide repeat protein [Blastocatellia bacterium]